MGIYCIFLFFTIQKQSNFFAQKSSDWQESKHL